MRRAALHLGSSFAAVSARQASRCSIRSEGKKWWLPGCFDERGRRFPAQPAGNHLAIGPNRELRRTRPARYTRTRAADHDPVEHARLRGGKRALERDRHRSAPTEHETDQQPPSHSLFRPRVRASERNLGPRDAGDRVHRL